MSNSKSTVNVTVMIANKPITWPFKSLELAQSSFEHHQLAVTVALDVEGQEKNKQFLSISDFQDALGKSITVKIEPADEYVSSAETLEFVGIVNNVSFENDVEQINRVTFQAKSPTWLLDQAKKNRFWEEEDLSGVIKGIVGNYSIETGDFKPPSGTVPFLVQFAETDWKFLCRMCARESKWLYFDGKKLAIDAAKSKNTHSLDWAKNIGSFDLKMNIKQFDYRADIYQESGKQTHFTDSTKGSASTDFSKLTRKAASVSKSSFKEKSADLFPEHAETEDKIIKFLVSKKQSRIGELVLCNVQSNMPSIKVGDTVKVVDMKDFSGTYFVSEIRHTVRDGNSYYNEFVAVPLEIAHPSWKYPSTKIPQMQAGVVTDNKDPESRYRVRVKLNYTDDTGTQLETPFLRILTPHAGTSYGTYFLPDIGDEVMVGFERGNPEKPVVMGNLWNGQVKPESAVYNDDNNYKAIYTRGGNRIDIGDEGGKEYIKITNAANNSLFFECDGPKITMHTEGDLEIDAVKNIKMKAGENFSIEAGKNFSVKSGKATEFKVGSEAKIEATNDCTVKANNIKQSAQMNHETKAGMSNKAEGMMVDISGNTSVKVQGAIIQLN